MPIYAYKCSACGFAKDVLQKLSDAQLTECPNCHASAFSKQLSAPVAHFKGGGWYVTDFRDGSGKKPADKNADGVDGADKGGKADGAEKPAVEAGAAKSGDAPAAAPAAAPTPAPAPASAPSSAPSTKSE
jgi:putative FmdB family regulatory protein